MGFMYDFDRLVVTSGKMVLLDKLMKRRKEIGRRCASQLLLQVRV